MIAGRFFLQIENLLYLRVSNCSVVLTLFIDFNHYFLALARDCRCFFLVRRKNRPTEFMLRI